VPSAEEAVLCLRTNQTLMGLFELEWSRNEKNVVRLEFPCPHDGVFILRSEQQNAGVGSNMGFDHRAALWAWHPRLVPNLGAWPITKREGKHEAGTGRLLRFGFPGRLALDISAQLGATYILLVRGQRAE